MGADAGDGGLGRPTDSRGFSGWFLVARSAFHHTERGLRKELRTLARYSAFVAISWRRDKPGGIGLRELGCERLSILQTGSPQCCIALVGAGPEQDLIGPPVQYSWKADAWARCVLAACAFKLSHQLGYTRRLTRSRLRSRIPPSTSECQRDCHAEGSQLIPSRSKRWSPARP